MDKCGGGSYHGGDHGSNGKNLWCKDSWRLLRKSGQSNQPKMVGHGSLIMKRSMWLERFMISCMWRMAHNRIQTMDHLKKRRIISYDANTRCVLCNSHEEFSRRLLFECKFSHYIWSRCYEWCEETRAPPADCIFHFWKHKGMLTRKEESLIWWAVWVVIVWVI